MEIRTRKSQFRRFGVFPVRTPQKFQVKAKLSTIRTVFLITILQLSSVIICIFFTKNSFLGFNH